MKSKPYYKIVTLQRALATWAVSSGIGWAAWRALENYRKNGSGTGRPLWNWPWNLHFPVALVLAAGIGAGCAHTSARFVEVAPDGTRTEFRQANAVTWGSSLDEGSGDMFYRWGGDGSGDLAVGNAAQGAASGDPSETLLGIVAALLQGYIANVERPRPAPSADWTERLFEPETIEALGRAIRLRGP